MYLYNIKYEKKMYRIRFNDLIKWKMSSKRKPLLFLGARQVGKTYLLKQLGDAEYKQVAYVNFEHPSAPKGLFDIDFDVDRIITVLNAFSISKSIAKIH
jgi:predicted AAA+ superfamily ATPase